MIERERQGDLRLHRADEGRLETESPSLAEAGPTESWQQQQQRRRQLSQLLHVPFSLAPKSFQVSKRDPSTRQSSFPSRRVESGWSRSVNRFGTRRRPPCTKLTRLHSCPEHLLERLVGLFYAPSRVLGWRQRWVGLALIFAAASRVNLRWTRL